MTLLSLCEISARRRLVCGAQLYSAMNRFTTFRSKVEIWLSKLFQGRLPQKVMEPTENTAPPFAVSKYTMSLRISGSGMLVGNA